MAATVVVFGAGGPTGLACVARLLEATELCVRAVVRSKASREDTIRAAVSEWYCSSKCGGCLSVYPMASHVTVHRVQLCIAKRMSGVNRA